MAQARGVSVPMGGREWAMLLALAVLWGGSFFFNGIAVRERNRGRFPGGGVALRMTA